MLIKMFLSGKGIPSKEPIPFHKLSNNLYVWREQDVQVEVCTAVCSSLVGSDRLGDARLERQGEDKKFLFS